MKNWFKKNVWAIFMLATIVSLLIARTCSAQPISRESAASSGTDTGTITQSAIDTAKSGVAHPQTSVPGKTLKVKNQLYPGAPSPTELAAINRLNFKAESSPRKAICNFVNRLTKSKGPPVLQMANLRFLEHNAISYTFADSVFYLLKFPQWPIAFAVPEPLQNNNIFIFDKAAKLVLIKNNDELKKLFCERIHKVSDDQRARTITIAFLLLAEELAQDGMYQFNTTGPKIEVKRSAAGITSSGIISVKPIGGNAGEITAKLIFSPNGDLLSANLAVVLKAGIRPICQSTKLLDRDPIVRRMAEQDLFIMGKAAKPYLDEQRKKVSPRLQHAIDKVWKRIQLEDR